MKKEFIVVTNNPLVNDKYKNDFDVEYEEISYEEVLKKVRNYVYNGYELLTHPLSGSVKPNETPYKSVLVSKKAGEVNPDAVKIIENAVSSCAKFQFKSDKYAPEVYEDFQYVDYTLIDSAMPSATAW